MKKLFGTSGIRGSAEELFTNQFSFDLGRAFAKFLDQNDQSGCVVVGMDPRPSSPRIKKAFVSGLTSEGREVRDEGITPIPSINYLLIADPGVAGGVMVTGSHIRSELNGIKFFAFDEEISKDHEAQITTLYKKTKEEKKHQQAGEPIEEGRASEFYVEMLLNLAQTPYPSWKVVIDPGNGAQSRVMPTLFEELKLKTLTINNDPEAPLLNRDPEAPDQGGFELLREKVKESGADFGIAYDSDGDRVSFITKTGEFIAGDYIGALLAKYSPSEKVVTPINTSQVIDQIGKGVIRTKVGSPYVVGAMKRENASFGFEANGGTISSEIMLSRDGGATTIKILNLMGKVGKSLDQLIAELPKYYLFRTKVDCPSELNERILKKAEADFQGVKVEKIDGLKIWVDDSSWILFRPSSNAPEFRVFTEGKTQSTASNLGQKGIEFVKKEISDNEK